MLLKSFVFSLFLMACSIDFSLQPINSFEKRFEIKLQILRLQNEMKVNMMPSDPDLLDENIHYSPLHRSCFSCSIHLLQITILSIKSDLKRFHRNSILEALGFNCRFSLTRYFLVRAGYFCLATVQVFLSRLDRPSTCLQ